MDKQKFLFITLSLDAGGAEKVFNQLIQGFYNDFELIVVTFYDRGHYRESIKSLPIKYYSLHAENGNTLSFAWRLRKILMKEKPESILSLLYYPNIIAFLAKLGMNIKYFPSERSNPQSYLTNSFKHRVWRSILKLCYKNAEQTIVLTKQTKKILEDDYKTLSSKIIIIPNGLDFKSIIELSKEPVYDFEFSANMITFVAVGRYTHAKNYPLLISAFSNFHAKFPSSKLAIIGWGELKKDLELMIQQKNVNDCVSLLGFKSNPHAYVAKASCYVLSSSWEGFPNALVEAMYTNGHVISTDCPTGPSEIITHNHDGILCPVNDVEGLTKAMEKMCFDEPFREMVYKNSRNTVLKFSEGKMVEGYKNLLQ